MSKPVKSVITCDLDGKIETFNEGAQELFGYTPDEAIGRLRVSACPLCEEDGPPVVWATFRA